MGLRLDGRGVSPRVRRLPVGLRHHERRQPLGRGMGRHAVGTRQVGRDVRDGVSAAAVRRTDGRGRRDAVRRSLRARSLQCVLCRAERGWAASSLLHAVRPAGRMVGAGRHLLLPQQLPSDGLRDPRCGLRSPEGRHRREPLCAGPLEDGWA